MAERFEAKDIAVQPYARRDSLETDVAVDISTDFVDLYLGKGMSETHVRWDRKTGKVSRGNPNDSRNASSNQTPGQGHTPG